VTTLVVSVLVWRRLDFTLEAMAILSLIPAFQGIVLCRLAREGAHRAGNRMPDLIQMASYRAVRMVWILAALALTGWILRYFEWFSGSNPRALATVISGAGLVVAGVGLMVGVRRRSDQRVVIRPAPLAVVCGAFGLLCVAAGFGISNNLLPPLGIVTAAVWGLGAAALIPVLLWAAPVLRPGSALLLESSAVLAAASMLLIPLLLYYRPYSGAAWLDPCRFALLLGTVFILTAAVCSGRPSSPEITPSTDETRSSARAWIALWLTLQGSYLVGWLGLGFVLGGGPDFSLGSSLNVVVIPAVQFLTIFLYRFLRFRLRELSAAIVSDARCTGALEESGRL